MKNTGLVFSFEFRRFVSKKSYWILSLVLAGIFLILVSLPNLTALFGKDLFNEAEDLVASDVSGSYGLVLETEKLSVSDLQGALGQGELKLLLYDDKASLKASLVDGDIDGGFLIRSLTDYVQLVENSQMTGAGAAWMTQALTELYRDQALREAGIDGSQVEEIYAKPVVASQEVVGKDGVKNYFYTYILTFALYFLVLFYGQATAVSVASEKSNRSMEILVVSTSPESLIFGKVLAAALAGLAQFVFIFGTAFLAYGLQRSAWGGRLDFLFSIPGEILLTFFIFGGLGYLLFLFIYAVLGALVSRVEDMGTSSTPLTLLFVGAFFVSLMGLASPESSLIKLASFFPFTSFMAMFVRSSMTMVPFYQLLISALILLATTLGVGLVGAGIYRLGTLMYGNPISFSKAISLYVASKKKP